jgi:hypothetical protein
LLVLPRGLRQDHRHKCSSYWRLSMRLLTKLPITGGFSRWKPLAIATSPSLVCRRHARPTRWPWFDLRPIAAINFKSFPWNWKRPWDLYVLSGVPNFCRLARAHRLIFLVVGYLQGTADLALRIGLNSGPTTAGVLRGEKSRFQLFGDVRTGTVREQAALFLRLASLTNLSLFPCRR